jgi:hypothetical protein
MWKIVNQKYGKSKFLNGGNEKDSTLKIIIIIFYSNKAWTEKLSFL